MITTVYAITLASLLVLPVLLLFLFDKKIKRRERRQLLSHLNEVAKEKELRFSGQEIVSGLAFGLDGINRKLVLVEKMQDSTYYSTIIHLDGMEACTTWKQYVTISRKDGFETKNKEGVKSIVLMLHLGEKQTVEIPFYRSYENKAGDQQALEQRARHWEVILSKMIMPQKKRA